MNVPNPIKLKAIVERIVPFGDGIYRVDFRSDVKFPRFKPGQFLHLTVDEYEPAGGFWPESRVFSIACPPGSETLTIVYSVKGRYTKRMESFLAPEKELWLKYPFGEFIIESGIYLEQDIIMIAGGTGISPYISYLAKVLESGSSDGRTLKLYYGVRKTAHVLFADLLDRCAKIDGVMLCIFVENGDYAHLPIKHVETRSGPLDIELIHSETNSLRNPAYFLSGPPAMIQLFRKRLESFGVAGKNINIDEWE
jgi:ferredoxin-NADP reductase